MIRLKLILFCMYFLCSAIVAAEQKNTVSPGLFKKLKKADKLVAEQKYAEALAIAESGYAAAKTDYEKATFLRSQASIHALRGHYAHAAGLLKKSIDLNALNEEQQQQALYDLGQLYMATEQYAQAITILETWLQQNKSNNAELYVLLANAHSQLKHYRKALPYITRAIKMSKKPPISWYELNLALYYELPDYQAASQILTKMIRLKPDHKPYWNQLVAVYQQQQKYKQAASVKQLGYQQKLYREEAELLDLVNLLLFVDMPYQAAQLLKDEIKQGRINRTAKNLTLLADAWTQAHEYPQAINTLKQAAKLSNNGKLQQRLGHIYVEQEQWQEAVSALSQALNKGKIKQTGNTYLLLGISYFELDKPQQSKQAFKKALKYSASKKSAASWLDYLNKLAAAENT